MTLERFLYICLAVFFVLYGLFAVTNFKVEWGPTLMGFAALVVGVTCGVRASK